MRNKNWVIWVWKMKGKNWVCGRNDAKTIIKIVRNVPKRSGRLVVMKFTKRVWLWKWKIEHGMLRIPENSKCDILVPISKDPSGKPNRQPSGKTLPHPGHVGVSQVSFRMWDELCKRWLSHSKTPQCFYRIDPTWYTFHKKCCYYLLILVCKWELEHLVLIFVE